MQNKGFCPRCGDANPYTNLVCSGCGARLPWADAVDPALHTSTPSSGSSQSQWGKVAGAGLAIGVTGGLALALFKWYQANKQQEEEYDEPEETEMPSAAPPSSGTTNPAARSQAVGETRPLAQATETVREPPADVPTQLQIALEQENHKVGASFTVFYDGQYYLLVPQAQASKVKDVFIVEGLTEGTAQYSTTGLGGIDYHGAPYVIFRLD
ncbi:MAG: hypothetical protein M3347_06675 [Armatimonadota bacterium]|nr:hypothetical protein [Armatimonadota bacterium]